VAKFLKEIKLLVMPGNWTLSATDTLMVL